MKKASDSDERWFKRNESRRFRLREMITGESAVSPEPFPGIKHHVIVAYLPIGARLRMLVPVLLFDNEANPIYPINCDEDLRTAFDKMAPPRLLELYKIATNGRGLPW